MNDYKEPTIPCETCGTPTDMLATKRCDGCWEVEGRLPSYLKHPKGVDFVRSLMPKLSDWKGGRCDAWDYEAVLSDNEVTVEPMPEAEHGYSLCWKQGFMNVPTYDETHAKKAAAVFIELWLRGVSASFADKLMDGFLFWLEATEQKRVCGTCNWYRENMELENNSHLTCFCPKMKYGYHHKPKDDEPDGLAIEADEGWGMIPGPKFGCIHHRMAQ